MRRNVWLDAFTKVFFTTLKPFSGISHTYRGLVVSFFHTLARISTLAVCAAVLCPTSASADFTPTSDFTDNNDGTVTHKLTGLTWLRCPAGRTWTGSSCTGTVAAQTWNEATSLTTTFAGNSDWRLPTPWEFATIIKYDSSSPSINTQIFTGFSGGSYWTSTAKIGDSAAAWWFQAGSDGRTLTRPKTDKIGAILVRGGQPPASLTTPTSAFVDNGDGTVTHKLTGLTWMRCPLGQSWTDQKCQGNVALMTAEQTGTLNDSQKTFAGKTDWRLPDVQELLSIVEYGVEFPAINTAIFSAPDPSNLFLYWSSTPYQGAPGYFWRVYFRFGEAVGASPTSTYGVRLVRGSQNSIAITEASACEVSIGSALSTIAIAGAENKRTGDALEISYCAKGFDPVTPLDLYIAVFYEEANIFLFLQCSGDLFCSPAFYPNPTPYYSLASPRDIAGKVLTIERLPADTPPGTYTFYAIAVKQGADPMNFSNWVGNLVKRQMRFAL